MSAMGDVADPYAKTNLDLRRLAAAIYTADSYVHGLYDPKNSGRTLPGWYTELTGAAQSLMVHTAALMKGVTYAMHTEHDSLIHYYADCGISSCQNLYCKQHPERRCIACDQIAGDGHLCMWSNRLQRTVKLTADQLLAADGAPWEALRDIEDAETEDTTDLRS